MRRLLLADANLVVTEPVAMELLAGARSSRELQVLHSRLGSFPFLHIEGLADYEQAAFIYRTCRSAGETIRSLVDCLIAVPAIRGGAAVLHNNADFDAIARHTELVIHPIDDG